MPCIFLFTTSQVFPSFSRYNKTEDLVPGGKEMMSYSHMLIEEADLPFYKKKTHTVLEKVDAFYRISLDNKVFPFITLSLGQRYGCSRGVLQNIIIYKQKFKPLPNDKILGESSSKHLRTTK